MKKLVCLTLVLMFVLSLFVMPAYAMPYEGLSEYALSVLGLRDYKIPANKAPVYEAPARVSPYGGTVYVSDYVCYINNCPIPCYMMKNSMFIQVENLNSYGFDVLWNPENESLRIIKDDSKLIDGVYTEKPFSYEIGEKLFDLKKTAVKTYIGDYGYEIECFAGLPGCTYINVDNLSVFGKMNRVDEEKAVYITTSNPDALWGAMPIKNNPDKVSWYDHDAFESEEGHKHSYDFDFWSDDENYYFDFGRYSEKDGELSACSFCYGTFYVDLYDGDKLVYSTSEDFAKEDFEKKAVYLGTYFTDSMKAPVGYEVKVPQSKLGEVSQYTAQVKFSCDSCKKDYEEQLYIVTKYYRSRPIYHLLSGEANK